jgi:serine/threonine protein kinase
MIPEQAELGCLDVDTRSDIYRLGVLLYELLTGTQPSPERRLRGMPFSEVQRILVHELPERPSTRLRKAATSGESENLPRCHSPDAVAEAVRRCRSPVRRG